MPDEPLDANESPNAPTGGGGDVASPEPPDPRPWRDPYTGKRYAKQRGPYLPVGNLGDDLIFDPRDP